MAIQIVDNFQVNIAQAIDNRLVVGPGQFYTDKDSLPYKYAGMRVWDLNTKIPYVWDGATFSTELASSISGSGTANYIPKFISPGNVIQNSIIYDDANNVGIGTTNPDKKLTVNGDIRTTGPGGFYGIGTYITNINATNITSGTLQLTRLQNTTQVGSILVSGTSQPVYTSNMTIDSPPAGSSAVTVLNFKNFNGPSRIYSHNLNDTPEFRFENHQGGTYLYLRPEYIDTNVPLRVPPGNSGLPTLSFTNDPYTGIYRHGNHQLGFTTGGTMRSYITTSGFYTNVRVQSPDFFATNYGTTTNPSIKVGSTGTGMFRDTGFLNNLSFVTGGKKRFQVSTGNQIAYSNFEFFSLLGGGVVGSSMVYLSLYDNGLTFLGLDKAPVSDSNRLIITGFNANTINGRGGVEIQNGLDYRYTSSQTRTGANSNSHWRPEFHHNLGYIPIFTWTCTAGNHTTGGTYPYGVYPSEVTKNYIKFSVGSNGGGNATTINVWCW